MSGSFRTLTDFSIFLLKPLTSFSEITYICSVNFLPKIHSLFLLSDISNFLSMFPWHLLLLSKIFFILIKLAFLLTSCHAQSHVSLMLPISTSILIPYRECPLSFPLAIQTYLLQNLFHQNPLLL